MHFVKPTLFSFGYDYYSSARMVAPQLNHQIILLLKHPLTHYWTSPLIPQVLGYVEHQIQCTIIVLRLEMSELVTNLLDITDFIIIMLSIKS